MTTPLPILLHNPRCSKSRAAKALLDERGVAYEERCYLDTPLSRSELTRLRSALALAPRDWARRFDDAWREAGLDANASDDAVLDAMAKHPILIERPILWAGDRALVGRPPERVLELVD